MLLLALLVEAWNAVPDDARYAVTEVAPLLIATLRTLAALTGNTLFEDMSIGG